MSFLKWLGDLVESAVYAAAHDPPARDEITFGSTALKIQKSRADVEEISKLVENRDFLGAVAAARKLRVYSDTDTVNYRALIRNIAEFAYRANARSDLKVMLTDPEIASRLSRDQRERFASI